MLEGKRLLKITNVLCATSVVFPNLVTYALILFAYMKLEPKLVIDYFVHVSVSKKHSD